MTVAIPLGYIKDISKFLISSLIANILVLICTLIIIYYNIFRFFERGPDRYVNNFIGSEENRFLNYNILVGTSLFAYSNIHILMPVKDYLRNKTFIKKLLI